MYKTLFYLFLLFFALEGVGAPVIRDTVPSGVPQLFGGKYYHFKGYVLADSFLMTAAGDTNAIPYFPSLEFKSSDNRWYGYDRSRWQKLLFPGDTSSISNRINAKLNISDTGSMLLPYLRKSDTAAMLLPYINLTGYGLVRSGQAIRVDTTVIGTINYINNLAQSINPEFYKPENYGAVRNGSTDDAAAFQAMFDDMPATGGTILLQAGNYRINDSIIITKPFKLFGSGYKSVISTTNGEINLFVIRTTNFGHIIQDVQFLNSSITQPTAGSAIWVTGNGSGNFNQFARYENIYIDGFYNDFVNDLGSLFVMNKCILDNPFHYGLLLRNIFNPDSGDGMISDTYFNGNAVVDNAASIRYESSGGVKIVNCKFNANSTSFRPNYCIDLAMDGATSDMLISNCSMENFGISSIKMRLVSSGSGDLFRDVVINGNQITPWFGNSGSYIDIIGIEGIVITDNTFRKPPGAMDVAIALDSCENVTLLNNYVDFSTRNPVTIAHSTNYKNWNDLNFQWNEEGVAIGGSAPTDDVLLDIYKPGQALDIFFRADNTNGLYTSMAFGQEVITGGNYAQFIRYPNATSGGIGGDFVIANQNKKIVLSTNFSGGFRQDFSINSSGNLSGQSLDTDNSAPVTSGTTNVLISDNTGLISRLASINIGLGGTGNTSFTAYALLAGGTTSTGPLQQVSGTGSTGQVLTSNGAGALPTWEDAPTSGTYTPSLRNGANVTASTAYQCQYMRVGNVVTVSGKVDIDPTSATTTTLLGISLPISSALPNDFECGGTAACGAVSDLYGAIRADTTNDEAQIIFTTVTTVTNQSWFFTFTYLIDNS